MKILMVNVVCGNGSTGRICTDLAVALEELGHEVKIAYGRGSVPERYKKYAVRIGSDYDVYMHGLRARLADGSGFGSKRASERFIEWVIRYNPDVIHLHNLHGYYLNLEVLFNYLRSSKKRIIWTLHDCWAFTGHSAFCDAVNCNKWKSGCYKCPLVNEYPASYFDMSKRNWEKKKMLFSSVPNMTIVTPSKWLAEWTRQSFLKEYKVEVINNGIDIKQFKQINSSFKRENEIKNRFMVIGVASAWNKMKGLSDYIKLDSLLGEEYKIVLVGVSKRQQQKLPESILGVERTNSIQDLVKIYNAADLMVNLSYCENYPTNNLEAIACGTKVLSYDTGGSAETIHGNGVVVPRGDINAIAKAIEDCKNNCNQNNTTPQLDYLDKRLCVNKYVKTIMNIVD